MDIGTVSVRYAKALLKYSIELQEEDLVYQEMDLLSKVYLNAPQLRQMIENPAISSEGKLDLLQKAVGNDPSKATKSFLNLVVEKRRTTMLQFIANSYVDLYLKHKNITSSRLIVSSEVSENFVDKMRKIVEKNTNSQVVLNVEKDPTIGGGFVLEYGTYRIDASISSQIKNIRKSLMRAAGNS